MASMRCSSSVVGTGSSAADSRTTLRALGKGFFFINNSLPAGRVPRTDDPRDLLVIRRSIGPDDLENDTSPHRVRCKSGVPIFFPAVRLVILFDVKYVCQLICKCAGGKFERYAVSLLIRSCLLGVPVKFFVILHCYLARFVIEDYTTVTGWRPSPSIFTPNCKNSCGAFLVRLGNSEAGTPGGSLPGHGSLEPRRTSGP